MLYGRGGGGGGGCVEVQGEVVGGGEGRNFRGVGREIVWTPSEVHAATGLDSGLNSKAGVPLLRAVSGRQLLRRWVEGALAAADPLLGGEDQSSMTTLAFGFFTPLLCCLRA